MSNILIVDDEAAVRNMLEKTLSSQGYQCMKAADAGEARECLERESFDLALVDIQMPGESGLEFMQYARGRFPDMVVIMVTGVDDPKAIDDAIHAGIYSYVLKPFERRQMLLHVRNALQHREIALANRQYQENLEAMLAAKIGEIKEREQKYRGILENMVEGYFELDTSGNFTFMNNSLCRIFGCSAGELSGSNIRQFTDPETAKKGLRVFNKVYITHEWVRAFSWEMTRKDGSKRHVESSICLIRGTGDKITGFRGLMRDISEQKRAAETIRRDYQKQATLRRLLELSVKEMSLAEMLGEAITLVINLPWFAVEKKGAIFLVEDGVLVMKAQTGIAEPLLASCSTIPFGTCLCGRAASSRRIEFANDLDERHSIRYEGISQHGHYIVPILWESDVLGVMNFYLKVGHHYDEKEVEFLQSVANILAGMIKQRKAEEELKAAHAKAAYLLASVSSILIALDREDKIIEWNSGAEKTFGMVRDEVLGRKLAECSLWWEDEILQKAIEGCKDTGQTSRLDDVRYKDRDGKDRFLGITINSICGEDGTPLGTMIRGADITERRLLERQLWQAQKLESIGQLAAGIAHEINTPIQYVGDNVRFLQEGFHDIERLLEQYKAFIKACEAGEEVQEAPKKVEELAKEVELEYLKEEIPAAIEQTLEGVERVIKIVRAMKEFSHPGSEEKAPTDINKAIENTVTVARNEWKYVADLKTDLDQSLSQVPCFLGELNQVFLNMITNAAQAIGEVVGDGSNGKGTITIRTRRDGEHAEIRFEDTGIGIPEAIQTRIFDPFFTTKDVGKGTGQGLSIAHSVIVEKHGGTIAVESEVGKGTTFIIRLPMGRV